MPYGGGIRDAGLQGFGGGICRKKRVLRRMEQLLGALKGTEIAGVLKLPNGSAAPWKEVLTRTFTDMNEEMERSGSHFVFLWDEVPFLVDNVARREGATTAMEILDVLRSLGQDYPRVRLVLTGSVGLTMSNVAAGKRLC